MTSERALRRRPRRLDGEDLLAVLGWAGMTGGVWWVSSPAVASIVGGALLFGLACAGAWRRASRR